LSYCEVKAHPKNSLAQELAALANEFCPVGLIFLSFEDYLAQPSFSFYKYKKSV
jgi:hypothetical protein